MTEAIGGGLGARFRQALIVPPAVGLVLGLGLQASGATSAATAAWVAATVPVLAFLAFDIAASLRRGDLGLDIVAALSMSAALVFGQSLASAVVALMYAGGQWLEAYAQRRAGREMTALLANVPRGAMRHRDGGLEPVSLDAIRPGDRLLIRQGEIAPVDGTLADDFAVLDQSALTGESLPAQLRAGESVISGSVNLGGPFDLVAVRPAAESTYAGIVRLVEAAQRSRAPSARLADRFALGFLAATLLLAGAAWTLSHDPIRAVAVLVVATPCPLILAVPVAIVAGLSRAAGHGVLFKSGGAFETLARVRSLVLDKTGTLTGGRARLAEIFVQPAFRPDDVLRLAASLDQASKHVVAEAIVAAAQARRLPLTVPRDAEETAGQGVRGRVEGHDVLVGGVAFVRSRLGAPLELPARRPGTITAAVAVDGQFAGALHLTDELREGVHDLLADLKRHGIERIVLATGDRRDVAEQIASGLPIDSVQAELTAQEKVIVVLSERKYGAVMMVGDGVNDAPALAAADVGVAMGAGGAAAAAEVADVVLLVDRLDRLLLALDLSRRSKALALQSVIAGIGLSLAGMAAAAAGSLTPVQGALLQEAIDVAVILNALRALAGR